MRRKLITDAVVARAETLKATLTDLVVFRAEVNQPLPTVPDSNRVSRYLVIHPFGPAAGPDGDLAEVAVDTTYGFQVNCVAGFETDCEWLIDKVDDLFYRWTPVVEGLVFGMFKPPPGYQPGSVRTVTEAQPVRFWLPLQYQTVATL